MRLKYLPLWGGLIFLLCASSVHASNATKEATVAEINPSTAPLCVDVSTSAWTPWPAKVTGNWSGGRDGVWFTDQSTGTAAILGLITKKTFPGTPSTTKFDFRINDAASNFEVHYGSDFQIWLKSLHTATEEFCGREYRMK